MHHLMLVTLSLENGNSEAARDAVMTGSWTTPPSAAPLNVVEGLAHGESVQDCRRNYTTYNMMCPKNSITGGCHG
jgi:hypothetical protein